MRLCLLLLCFWVQWAFAHPLAPALLQVQEQENDRYDVLWRTSVTRISNVDVQPLFPKPCVPVSKPELRTEGGDAVSVHWTLDCKGQGLRGKTVQIQGIEQSQINVIVRSIARNGSSQTALLGAQNPRYVFNDAPQTVTVFFNYLKMGCWHLWRGFDHLLFVLGLCALLSGFYRRLWSMTAFTLGHSVTLVAATLGLVQASSAVMEWLIALTLWALAWALLQPSSQASLLRRQPYAMAALFGLIHGLGFAGALQAVGLPEQATATALLGFNLGIEIGQLLVVLALQLLIWLVLPRFAAYGLGVKRVVAYVIGGIAAYWLIERGLSLFAV